MASEHERSKEATRVSAPKHKTVRHRLHRTMIEHHSKGGHTITHSFQPMGKAGYDMMGSHKPDESSVAADNAALHQHMAQRFPGGDAGKEKPPVEESEGDEASSTQEDDEEMPA